jgi:hypothetical protein
VYFKVIQTSANYFENSIVLIFVIVLKSDFFKVTQSVRALSVYIKSTTICLIFIEYWISLTEFLRNNTGDIKCQSKNSFLSHRISDLPTLRHKFGLMFLLLQWQGTGAHKGLMAVLSDKRALRNTTTFCTLYILFPSHLQFLSSQHHCHLGSTPISYSGSHWFISRSSDNPLWQTFNGF